MQSRIICSSQPGQVVEFRYGKIAKNYMHFHIPYMCKVEQRVRSSVFSAEIICVLRDDNAEAC